MSAKLKIFFVSLVLLIVFGILLLAFGPTAAGIIVSLVSLVVTMFTVEVRQALGIDSDSAVESSMESKVALMLRHVGAKVKAVNEYIKFAFLVVAAILVSWIFYDAAIIAIEDLVAKGFVVFRKEGFFHMQVYLFGFIIAPVFSCYSAIYGFVRGASTGEIAFLKLFFASLIGFLFAIGVMMLVRGDVTAANQEIVSQVHGDSLPMGTWPLRYTVQAGAALVFSFGLSAWVWTWVQIGRFAIWGINRVGEVSRKKL
jgi:hypothetical protein